MDEILMLKERVTALEANQIRLADMLGRLAENSNTLAKLLKELCDNFAPENPTQKGEMYPGCIRQ